MRKICCILLFIFSLLPASQLNAQCKDWIWPEDKSKAQEQFVLLQDAVKAKQFKQAVRPLQWLLTNTPSLNVSIYIRGAEVYDGLAKSEKEIVRKAKFVDSLMIIYDLRMKQCDDKANVMTRKAMAYFKYNINGTEPEKVFVLMEDVLNLTGNNISDNAIVPYMETLVRTQLKEKKLSENEILDRYDKLISIVDNKIKASEKDLKRRKKLEGYKSKIDELLLKVVNIDCEFVHKQLAHTYKKNPGDLPLARKIFGYLLKGNCSVDSLWISIGEFIYQNEKDFGLAKNLGVQFYVTDNIEKAKFYFNEGLKEAKTNIDSADIYMYQGSVAVKENDPSGARIAFRKAIKADVKRTSAWEKIGDLYFNSFDNCAKKTSMADDRLVYLIAYDYYQKAGDTKKMALAEKAFPSREEIFLVNYSKGQAIEVKCWINEMTTIRTRD